MPRKRGAQATPESFPVVGIAASAGGLEPISELLGALPAQTGMGFVVIQHLAPNRRSMLPEILSRATHLRVQEAVEGARIERENVYVIPSGKDLFLSEGRLRLTPRKTGPGSHRPADAFLVSLAEELGPRGIAVILSGTDGDGSLGCEAIKEEGGISFAQNETAEYAGMPESAIAGGCIDFVLSPRDIAAKLGAIAGHPYFAQAPKEAGPSVPEDDVLAALEILHQALGVDFRQYKRNTIKRRLARRMVVNHTERPEEYRRLLSDNPVEVQALYQDILISVTSFFRNPEVFEYLKREIFPRLYRDRSRHDPVRMWVAGCATGEEAYSLAILAAEYAEGSGGSVPVQIFASDLNGVGIERARAGMYPRSISHHVSPERLRRFFTETDGGYRISKAIREVTVFAEHNAVTDPPFSRIDLLACRNLMIYLEPALQQRLLPVFHYALRPSGYLWLGTSETIGSERGLFEPVDSKFRIYRKKASAQRSPIGFALPSQRGATEGAKPASRDPLPIPADAQREADRLLLARYAPAAVLINADLEIMQFRGDTTSYLMPAPGKASLSLLKMLREGLMVAVRGALQKALREESPVRQEGLRVRTDRGQQSVSIEVVPIRGSSLRDGSFLVTFEGARPAGRKNPPKAPKPRRNAETRARAEHEITRVTEELAATREYLQSVIEQQEAVNEELQSANEEVQSTNEELQSINEELETSKEEVQSNNEELATVNDELNTRNLELIRSNSDFGNLLQGVELPIVRLGTDLRIQWFTPAAEPTLNLIRADVGRSILDFKLPIEVPDLGSRLSEVAASGDIAQIETQDRDGRWYSLRLRPYRTRENRIDGVLMVLVDVDSLKRAEQSLRQSENRFRNMADSAPVQIWVHGPQGLEFANRPFLEYFGLETANLGKFAWDRYVHPEDQGLVSQAYESASRDHREFRAQARLRRADGEYRWHKIVGVPHNDSPAEAPGLIGSSFDVTDLKQAEEVLRESDRNKNQFLAMLAHELRNPLAPLRNVVHLLKTPDGGGVALENIRGIMERQIQNIARMIDDLLDVARVTQGKVQIRKEPVELGKVLADAIAQALPAFEAREQKLSVDVPDEPLQVDGDAVRLGQIVANLLANAAKFTPRGGNAWLTVRVTNPGDNSSATDMVEIALRDDGAGIDPETLPRIFEPFMQADRSLARSQGGLGLGLTLVKSIVQLHGGTVSAESAGPGQGSEFKVRLPLVSHGIPVPGKEEAPPLPARRQKDMRRVLVVDDNVDAGDTLALLLRLSRHEVAVVRDGTEAVRVADAFRPEFVLLDIGLPGKDGYEVARELRGGSVGESAVLVAITGYGQAADRERAREAGIDHHFTKPLDFSSLQVLLADPPRSAR